MPFLTEHSPWGRTDTKVWRRKGTPGKPGRSVLKTLVTTGWLVTARSPSNSKMCQPGGRCYEFIYLDLRNWTRFSPSQMSCVYSECSFPCGLIITKYVQLCAGASHWLYTPPSIRGPTVLPAPHFEQNTTVSFSVFPTVLSQTRIYTR